MNALIIAKRELSVFFISPIAYIAGAIFLFVTGLAFFFTVAFHNKATFLYVFNIIPVILFFVTPLLTSRLLSTETHSGTLELLLTAPVRNREVVIGKFLAAFLLLLTVLIPTLTYLILLMSYGNPEIPVIISGYLGVVLLGAMVVSMGVLTSALATNQIMAGVLAVVFSTFFWLVGGLGTIINGWPGYLFIYLSSQEHFIDFVLGLITTNNIVYFLSITIGALFVATRILEARRLR